MASGRLSRRSSIAHSATQAMLAFALETWIVFSVASAERTSVVLPSIISSCLSPMNLSTALKWQNELIYNETLEDVSLFCEEGGLICDENMETPYVTLSELTTYCLSKPKEANLHNHGVFFKESELSLGNVMKLPGVEDHIPTRAFLPPILEPFLFNSSTIFLSNVLLPFGFDGGNPLAKSMHETLQICKASPMEGETKACMATFEGMFGFATSLMASTNVSILASSILPPEQLVKLVGLQEMTNNGEKVVVACHNAMFPFQVFYCHHIKGTKVFHVTLQTTTSKDTILAIASCHPQFEASFVEIEALLHLNVGPNELLCHWNHGDNIVWVPHFDLLSPSTPHSSQLTLD